MDRHCRGAPRAGSGHGRTDPDQPADAATPV